MADIRAKRIGRPMSLTEGIQGSASGGSSGRVGPAKSVKIKNKRSVNKTHQASRRGLFQKTGVSTQAVERQVERTGKSFVKEGQVKMRDMDKAVKVLNKENRRETGGKEFIDRGNLGAAGNSVSKGIQLKHQGDGIPKFDRFQNNRVQAMNTLFKAKQGERVSTKRIDDSKGMLKSSDPTLNTKTSIQGRLTDSRKGLVFDTQGRRLSKTKHRGGEKRVRQRRGDEYFPNPTNRDIKVKPNAGSRGFKKESKRRFQEALKKNANTVGF